MPYSISAKNLMLDALDITQVSAHSADPGSDGLLNEISGGSPAYARVDITHDAAVDGNRDSNVTPQFNMPAGSAIAFNGYWAGTEFRGSNPVSAPETFTGQGVYNLADSDLSLSD